MKQLYSNSLYGKSMQDHFLSIGLDFMQAQSAVKRIYPADKSRLDTSFHYELFAALVNNAKPDSILEIGTHFGYFTEFLAKLAPKSKIVTLELPENSSRGFLNDKQELMKKHYGRDVPKVSSNRLSNYKNVTQVWLDSTYVVDCQEIFNLIWIDGDRSFPVIAFDIINSLRILSAEGIVCVDDIKLTSSNLFPFGVQTSKLSADEPIKTLTYLREIGLISFSLIPKRVRDMRPKKMGMIPKYIAVIKRVR